MKTISAVVSREANQVRLFVFLPLGARRGPFVRHFTVKKEKEKAKHPKKNSNREQKERLRFSEQEGTFLKFSAFVGDI